MTIPAEYLTAAQIWGYVALVTYVAAYLFHDDKKLKLAFSFSNIFWMVHYWLVGAHTAALTTVVITVRNLISLNVTEMSQRWRIVSASICTVLLVIVGVFSWAGVTSAIAVVTTIIVTWTMFFTGGVRMRLIFLGVDAAWLVHAILVMSYSGMAYAIGSIAANLYTIANMRARSSAG